MRGCPYILTLNAIYFAFSCNNLLLAKGQLTESEYFESNNSMIENDTKQYIVKSIQ